MIRFQPFDQFTKLNLLSFTWAFLVIQAVIFPLFLDSGLSQGDAFLVMGVFSLTMAFLDVPAGLLSDRIGRRTTLIYASIFKGIGGMVLIFSHGLSVFIAAYVFIGIANSLLSGTDLALLYETHAQAQNPPPIFNLLAQRNLFSKYGTALSSLLGGALASGGYRWPLLLNAGFAWMALLIAFSLWEPRQHDSSLTTRSWRDRFKIGEAVWETRRKRYVIFALVLLSVVFVTAQWSFQSFWKAQNVTFFWMGVLWASYNLMGGHAVKSSVRLLGHEPARLIYSSLALAAVGLLGAGLLPGTFGLISCLLVPVGLSPALVQLRHLLNDDMKPEWRATLNSIDSFLSRIIFFIASPFLGRALANFGFSASFNAVGSVLAVTSAVVMIAVLYLSQLRKTRYS